jgi:hypothetical protein
MVLKTNICSCKPRQARLQKMSKICN